MDPLTDNPYFMKEFKGENYTCYFLVKRNKEEHDSVVLSSSNEKIMKIIDFEVSCGILKSTVEISKRYSELLKEYVL